MKYLAMLYVYHPHCALLCITVPTLLRLTKLGLNLRLCQYLPRILIYGRMDVMHVKFEYL